MRETSRSLLTNKRERYSTEPLRHIGQNVQHY